MRHAIIPAAAALAAILAAQPAQAQTASYCDGRLTASDFRAIINPNGSGARVDYSMQLRNETATNLAYAVTFNARFAERRQYGASTSIGGGRTTRVALGLQFTPSPTGAGSPNAAQLPAFVTVACR
jgi:hypothetical protein